jgi:hypothetical protein
MRIPVVAGTLALALCAAAPPAAAVDGVIEINQAGALAGTPDGTPGFPVTISEPGSYHLTSNLEVPATRDGFSITGSDVSLDLNGFRILAAAGSGANDHGAFVGGAVQNPEIRNGSIEGFGDSGVWVTGGARDPRMIGLRVVGNAATGLLLQAEGSLVRECTVAENGADGIRGFPGSLVVGNVVRNNKGFGLLLNDVGWGSNVIAGNNGGEPNPQVNTSRGGQVATNVCGVDTTCP